MFKKNLEALNNPCLKKRLEGISLEESVKGIAYCMSESNDYVLMKDDVPLDDLVNPKEDIQKMIRNSIKSPMGKNDIIIAFGMGLGYLLDELFNTFPSRIFLYEPDINILHFVLNNVDISEHLASGRVFVTDSLDELAGKLASSYITKDRVEVVYLKNYAVIKNQELFSLTQKVYETCKSKMIDVNTISKYSKKWLFNSLANISFINNSNAYLFSSLKNKFAGKTALIIAAGPSLNENIEKIKQNRDKFVIFAVNKVLKVLQENEIIPDFAVCLDASNVNNTLLGLEDFLAKINCITDLKSDLVLASKPFKKIFFTFSSDDLIAKKLQEHNDFVETAEYGGSATTMALVCAKKTGVEKIIFTGLDLAFREDVAYSSGEVVNKISESQITVGNIAKTLVTVPSVTGGVVKTREDYEAFIHHFEILLRNYPEGEVYNTTSFGAKIEGMINKSFDEVLSCINTNRTLVLGEETFKFELSDWIKEEMFLINNIISNLSKNEFSPALVSSIVKSSLIYEYMQGEVVNVMQSDFSKENAEGFIEKTKLAIKEVINCLQNLGLI